MAKEHGSGALELLGVYSGNNRRGHDKQEL